MKRRFAEPKNHKSIKEYDFKTEYIKNEIYDGYVSVSKIKKVEEDWFVPRDDETEVCILANNYTWIMLYPKNQKYAITAMYDENNQIIEWYFDMVKNIGIENGIPYIDDLYLDLVITKDGETYILDENELQEALDNNDITKEDFDTAYETLKILLEKFDNGKNIKELHMLTDKYI